MSLNQRDDVGDTLAPALMAANTAVHADLEYDTECPFRHHPAHRCARRDGRGVGVFGAYGDCFEGAAFAAYNGSIDDARQRHPSAYEPDVGYLLQQSLIDQAERSASDPLVAQYGSGGGL